MAVKCAHCGKDVEAICSKCWRCINCKMDCKEHMERTVNGHIGKGKVKAKG